MSNQEDPLVIAQKAERDLNSHSAKHGHDGSASTTESGIDTSATTKFPSSTATYGSSSSGSGNNREIPVEEGGDIDGATGKATKARDFEGEGGPETKKRIYEEANPGNEDVLGNVRQGGVKGDGSQRLGG
ncbi:MAG: hypothetical protein M1835_005089 [Candelina submexicana]|nr:MAG: hypothetical protein M1835_005089 [Candelina submexicana]